MANQSDILKQHLFSSLGLPWQDVLPESRMEVILDEEGIRYRHRLYTPIVTVWGMIYQVLCPSGEGEEPAFAGEFGGPNRAGAVASSGDWFAGRGARSD